MIKLDDFELFDNKTRFNKELNTSYRCKGIILEFLSQYGLFFAKVATVVVAIIVILVAAKGKGHRRSPAKGEIVVESINEQFEDDQAIFDDMLLTEAEFKAKQKKEKQKEKLLAKEAKAKAKALAAAEKVGHELKVSDTDESKPRMFVLDFDGDVHASDVEGLRRCITAVLSSATKKDEVFLRLESPGGEVHSYGLAAAQLRRLKEADIKLTVGVDKVAASGGYMMACQADEIIASPFALLGSIGVVAQMPNINRLLKKNDVDIELHTAGKYKRTLTMLGENTDEAREKFQQEIEDIHVLFKDWVSDARPVLDIEKVATGEAWFGIRALENKLVDQLKTTDSFLVSAKSNYDIYSVSWEVKKGLAERFGQSAAKSVVDNVASRVETLTRPQFK